MRGEVLRGVQGQKVVKGWWGEGRGEGGSANRLFTHGDTPKGGLTGQPATHALEGSTGLLQAGEGLEGGQPLMAGYVSASTPSMWSKALG